MNIPNKLTIVRILMIPFVMLAIMLNFENRIWIDLVAAALFGLAAATDFIDGMLARKMGIVTNFGKFLDPIADKLLLFGAIFAMLGSERFAHIRILLVIAGTLILLREFAVTSIRMVVTKEDGTVIAANFWGKFKTVFSDITVAVILLEGVLIPKGTFLADSHIICYIMMGITVILTLFSGFTYIKRYFNYIDPSN